MEREEILEGSSGGNGRSNPRKLLPGSCNVLNSRWRFFDVPTICRVGCRVARIPSDGLQGGCPLGTPGATLSIQGHKTLEMQLVIIGESSMFSTFLAFLPGRSSIRGYRGGVPCESPGGFPNFRFFAG